MKIIKEAQFPHLFGMFLTGCIFAYFFFGSGDVSIVTTCKDVLLAVVFYFFGSSAGSRRKQATIDNVIEKKGGLNELN